MSDPSQIERRSTSDQVVALLREQIATAQLAPGMQLREVMLARQIGVSRPTLREALRSLAHDGLVVHEQHRGTFIAALSPAEIIDIYQVRRVLECSAGRGCRTASALARAAVAEAHIALVEAWGRNDRDVIEADLAFHGAIVGMLASNRLAGVFESLSRALRPCLIIACRNEPAAVLRERSLEEHAAITEAITGRKPALAERLLRAHIDTNRELLLSLTMADDS